MTPRASKKALDAVKNPWAHPDVWDKVREGIEAGGRCKLVTERETMDIDQLLHHGVGAGKFTEAQAKIAKKIYQGQRVITTDIPGMMRLDDETVVETDDLRAFDEANLIGILIRGRTATLAKGRR